MKKTILALALATVAAGASAHVKSYTHYHDDGRVVIANHIAPKVEVTTETDRYGREIRVTTTTTCVDERVNRRNHHLTCREEEESVKREVIRRGPYNTPGGGYQGPGMPAIEPRVQRYIDRDDQGRRIIVTVTDTCTRSGYQQGQAVCYNWVRDIDRDYVRWNRDRNNLDLDGNGRTDAWERLLYQGFREVLENN